MYHIRNSISRRVVVFVGSTRYAVLVPSNPLCKKVPHNTNNGRAYHHNTSDAPIHKPNFGVVAAMTNDGVIGINGHLPWNDTPISQDLQHFINLTRNKILIVGRKTFADEDPSGGHVKHVRTCIVVSKTMDYEDLVSRRKIDSNVGDTTVYPQLVLARSFGEALDIASAEMQSSSGSSERTNEAYNDTKPLDIWVAGGERIYQEALQHKNATEVHLTHVDMTVLNQTTTKDTVAAYFPVQYLERCGFHEVSRFKSGICTFCVYKRLLLGYRSS